MKKINTRSAKIKIAILTLIIGGVVSAFKADYFEVNKQLELFTGVFKEVNLYYVDETEPGQLMESAMKGMLKSLDPYTVFIPESDVEDFKHCDRVGKSVDFKMDYKPNLGAAYKADR